MPNDIDSNLLVSISSEASSLCLLVRIKGKDGATIFTLTSHPQDITTTIDGSSVTFLARPGMFGSRIASGLDLTIDNAEVGAYLYSNIIRLRDVYGARLEGARYELFVADHQHLDYEPFGFAAGFLGEIPISDYAFKVALRSLTAALHQTVGWLLSPLCRAHRLGEVGTCNFPLSGTTRAGSGFAFRVATGTVSVVSNKITFTCSSGFNQPDKWFAGGVLRWLSTTNGNAGQEIEVLAYTNSGGTATFILQDRPGGDMVAGDTFTVDAGCNRTVSHCFWKFRTSSPAGYTYGNMKNFQGEPHLTDETELVKAADEWRIINFVLPPNPESLSGDELEDL